jgi:hypothetical protein
MLDFPALFYNSNVYEVSLRSERLEVLPDTDISALNGGGNLVSSNSHIHNADK